MTISYIMRIQFPDDIITVIAEFTLKNGVQHIYIYKTKKLLKMVTLTPNQTSQLNSDCKTGPGGI